jgi:hypothetical protein
MAAVRSGCGPGWILSSPKARHVSNTPCIADVSIAELRLVQCTTVTSPISWLVQRERCSGIASWKIQHVKWISAAAALASTVPQTSGTLLPELRLAWSVNEYTPRANRTSAMDTSDPVRIPSLKLESIQPAVSAYRSDY